MKRNNFLFLILIVSASGCFLFVLNFQCFRPLLFVALTKKVHCKFSEISEATIFWRAMPSPTLHEKCPYSEFYWCAFSGIWTEYEKISTRNSHTFNALVAFEPLMHHFPKWSSTLQKSYSICCMIFKECLTILGRYAWKVSGDSVYPAFKEYLPK